ALSHLAQARDLTSTLSEHSERLRLELKQEITLGRAVIAARGYTAPETREAYRRARQRCDAFGDQSLLPLIMPVRGLFAHDVPSRAIKKSGRRGSPAQKRELHAKRGRPDRPASSKASIVRSRRNCVRP